MIHAKLVRVLPKPEFLITTCLGETNVVTEDYHNWLDEYVGKEIYIFKSTEEPDCPQMYRRIIVDESGKLKITGFCIYDGTFELIRDVVLDVKDKPTLVELQTVKKYLLVLQEVESGAYSVSAGYYRSLEEFLELTLSSPAYFRPVSIIKETESEFIDE